MQPFEKQNTTTQRMSRAASILTRKSLRATQCCIFTAVFLTSIANAQSGNRRPEVRMPSTGNQPETHRHQLDPELARLVQQRERAVESGSDRFRNKTIEKASFQTNLEPVEEGVTRTPASTLATLLRATPADVTEEPKSSAANAIASSGPGEMFLDLTQERSTNNEKSSAKPVGERGAEVSISESPVQVLTRAVAWIVIALCLFSLAALGVRRWQRQRGLLPTTNARSRVIETLSVGPGRTVSLIEVGGFRALVASDAGGIKQLVLAPVSFQDEFSNAESESTHGRSLETSYTEVAGLTQT